MRWSYVVASGTVLMTFQAEANSFTKIRAHHQKEFRQELHLQGRELQPRKRTGGLRTCSRHIPVFPHRLLPALASHLGWQQT